MVNKAFKTTRRPDEDIDTTADTDESKQSIGTTFSEDVKDNIDVRGNGKGFSGKH